MIHTFINSKRNHADQSPLRNSKTFPLKSKTTGFHASTSMCYPMCTNWAVNRWINPQTKLLKIPGKCVVSVWFTAKKFYAKEVCSTCRQRLALFNCWTRHSNDRTRRTSLCPKSLNHYRTRNFIKTRIKWISSAFKLVLLKWNLIIEI